MDMLSSSPGAMAANGLGYLNNQKPNLTAPSSSGSSNNSTQMASQAASPNEDDLDIVTALGGLDLDYNTPRRYSDNDPNKDSIDFKNKISFNLLDFENKPLHQPSWSISLFQNDNKLGFNDKSRFVHTTSRSVSNPLFSSLENSSRESISRPASSSNSFNQPAPGFEEQRAYPLNEIDQNLLSNNPKSHIPSNSLGANPLWQKNLKTRLVEGNYEHKRSWSIASYSTNDLKNEVPQDAEELPTVIEAASPNFNSYSKPVKTLQYQKFHRNQVPMNYHYPNVQIPGSPAANVPNNYMPVNHYRSPEFNNNSNNNNHHNNTNNPYGHQYRGGYNYNNGYGYNNGNNNGNGYGHNSNNHNNHNNNNNNNNGYIDRRYDNRRAYSNEQQNGRKRGDDSAKFLNASIDDFKGQIYSLCRDQHGCRFLQRQLDINDVNKKESKKGSNGLTSPKVNENNAATLIFDEINTKVVELMTDQFGNYLIQKLLDQITVKQRVQLIRNSCQSFIQISFDSHGTRALQKLIEVITTQEENLIIIKSFENDIVSLSRDLNGNHVVQKMLTKFNYKPSNIQFIFDAAAKNCIKISTHRHGCCVLQRCLDYGSVDQCKQLSLVIAKNCLNLAVDPFGNYVVQYVLTKGEEESTNLIVEAITSKVLFLSTHKFGSNVIEKILRIDSLSHNVIDEILRNSKNSTIIGNPNGAGAPPLNMFLSKLLHDPYGNYVLQTVLDVAERPVQFNELSELIRPILPTVRNTVHGRRIAAKFHQLQNLPNV